MYSHSQKQLMIYEDEFDFSGIKLNSKNRWVRLGKLIPWDEVEEGYVKNFQQIRRGGEARSARFALGTLIIKEQLNLSDRETVQQIRENPYLQYFLGGKQYNYDIGLDASSLTYFRKRFSSELLKNLNRRIVSQYTGENAIGPGASAADQTSKDGEMDEKADGKEETPKPCGTLIVDATCTPADVQFPTDVRLLHEGRRKLESMMDHLQQGRKEKKPKNYRKRANMDYKRFVKNRRPKKSQIRRALRRQLGYVKRDLSIVEEMRQDSSIRLSHKEQRYLSTIEKLYEQQKEMYDKRKNSCEHRIVSIHQPHVRPIKRGKATAKTEFGAKVSIAMVKGYADVTRLSWEAYNESTDLIQDIEKYRARFGDYPERVLADKIYRTRDNLRYCRERGIRLSGPALGRRPVSNEVCAEQKRQERKDAGDRNAVEGKFGEGKRGYGLNRIMCRLEETSETQIVLIFLVMNLNKILRDLFCAFFKFVPGRARTFLGEPSCSYLALSQAA